MQVYMIEQRNWWSDYNETDIDPDQGAFLTREAAQARCNELNESERVERQAKEDEDTQKRNEEAVKTKARLEAVQAAGIDPGSLWSWGNMRVCTPRKIELRQTYTVWEDPIVVHNADME